MAVHTAQHDSWNSTQQNIILDCQHRTTSHPAHEIGKHYTGQSSQHNIKPGYTHSTLHTPQSATLHPAVITAQHHTQQSSQHNITPGSHHSATLHPAVITAQHHTQQATKRNITPSSHHSATSHPAVITAQDHTQQASHPAGHEAQHHRQIPIQKEYNTLKEENKSQILITSSDENAHYVKEYTQSQGDRPKVCTFSKKDRPKSWRK
ncbi:hypothetical protein PoB_003364500 [Plakobranchus ocellatus]|uniref:Uncharacterized protein n=1 Tax=Plakobranchus ocellatus TaxID=259542 RepID=A0AAV4AJX5_9GAST|nr:hypothetical protein PoB_003364500 [Plakobranchus ocellatus]